MKVKTNLRAGAGVDNSTTSGQKQTQNQSSKHVVAPPVYIPPVGRCVGY